MAREQPDYLSYLLRLWSTRDDDVVMWRALLESPHGGQRKGFASLDELFEYLRRRTGVSSDQGKEVMGTEVGS
jgi:hypothetical protein